MASDTSLLHSRPTMPGMMRTFRSSTSAQIITVMARISPAPSRASAPRRRPYPASMRSMRFSRDLRREKLLQLRPVLRARLDRAGPAYLLRLLDVGPAGRRIECDRLDAGLGLLARLFPVVRLPEFVLSLIGEGLTFQHVARRGGHGLPFVQVHYQRNLGVVEPGVDAELGLFLPIEVEDGVDRPAVAVDHPALERGVDLARRGGHHRPAERLEEVAVHRRDA